MVIAAELKRRGRGGREIPWVENALEAWHFCFLTPSETSSGIYSRNRCSLRNRRLTARSTNRSAMVQTG